MAQILNGKVGISVARAISIAETIGLSEHDKKIFVALVQAEHDRNPTRREEAKKILDQIQDGYDDVSDVFHSIADWHFHAIREMISLNDSTYNDETMPGKIGISREQYNDAIERMLSLKLIEKLPGTSPGQYRTRQKGLRTQQDVPSEAVKILNEQIFEKAKMALRTQSVEERDFSIIFFKFDKEQIPLAKERLQAFRRSLMQEFELSESKNSVYCMGIQFFELTGQDIIEKRVTHS